MPKPYPVLKAYWRDLLLLNFQVPVAEIESLCPVGTEPDVHNGQAFISMVGFSFRQTRLFGLPVPAHTRFDEINLRYYVRRVVGDEVRRGVVFIREIVPRRALSLVANLLYNENYVTRPMRSVIEVAGSELSPGDRIEYGWRSRPDGVPQGDAKHFWNRLSGRVAAPLALPAPGSLEEFIVEHYWGYVRGRDCATREYRVVHIPWRVAPAADVVWECDLPATYKTPLAKYLDCTPASAIIANGSPIQVFSGQRLG